MRAPAPASPVDVLLGGAASGVAASAAMLLAVGTLPTADGPIDTLRAIAATWVGVGALVGGPFVVLLGLLTHLAVGAAWGALAGAFVRDDTPGVVAVAIGLVWGAAAWLLMTWGVLPVVDPVLYARLALDPWAWLIAHVAFGAVLGVAPWAERAVHRVRAPRPPRRQKPVLVLHTFRRRGSIERRP